MSLCRADDTCSSNLGADLNVCVDTRLDMTAQRNIYTRLTSRLKVSLGMQSEVCINCSKPLYCQSESGTLSEVGRLQSLVKRRSDNVTGETGEDLLCRFRPETGQ